MDEEAETRLDGSHSVGRGKRLGYKKMEGLLKLFMTTRGQ